MSGAPERILGPYRLLEQIGKGGMGEVYRARHTRLGSERAVKVLPGSLANEADFLKRFEREAASAAGLTHPHILPVYDYGEQDGTPYLVMPYITGGTLKDRLQGNTVSPAQLIKYLSDIADALDYAHQRGLVHRDVKPGNILIDEHDQAFLSDFGIAKAVEGAEQLTRAGVGVGTPEYMAPEQAQGIADTRSDLYALGIMVYQALTGQVPFTGNSTVEVLMKQMQDPVPLTPLRGAVATYFTPVLQRALAKDPNARYQTGRELMAAVSTAMAQSGVDRAEGASATVIAATPVGEPPVSPPFSAVPPPPPNPMRPTPGTPPPSGNLPPLNPGTPPPSGYRPPANPGTPPPSSALPPPNAGMPTAVAPLSGGVGNTVLAGMNPQTRRILLIIAAIVITIILCCCCLWGLSVIGNSSS